MHFYLYKITNNVNGKIYAGVHKTTDLDDGYMGSGKVIKAAIKKYGIENFTKEILAFFDNSADMFAAEKELVTEEFLLREDVYNLRRGGTGGFDYINSSGLNLYGANGKNGTKNLMWGDAQKQRMIDNGTYDAYRETISAIQKQRIANGHKTHFQTSNPMFDPVLRQKHKEALSNISHQQGNKNSQFGSMWITDGTTNKKISNKDTIPEGWRRGRVTKVSIVI